MKKENINLPTNNVNFEFKMRLNWKVEILDGFIKSHNKLYDEYNAIRVQHRFYSKQAYLFFKVEENVYTNFVTDFPTFSKIETVEKYLSLVTKLVGILEYLKIHS